MKTNMDTTTLHDEPELKLEITRRFNASRTRVFRAFSSAEAMTHWFGPARGCMVGGEVDFREGGRYRLQLQTETIGIVAVGGTYRTILEPEKIAFSWQWEPHPELANEEMEIVINFIEVGETETELKLVQTGFSAREVAENHGKGWNGAFDNLVEWFAEG